MLHTQLELEARVGIDHQSLYLQGDFSVFQYNALAGNAWGESKLLFSFPPDMFGA
jgi:hypothetical protein